MSAVRIEHGDCLDVMRRLAEEGARVDSVVCDPPYHLTSIVRRFGSATAAPAQFGTDGAFARASAGFMGQQWDGGDVAFRPEVWALASALLPPGGHLLAMGGTRTYHRLACAIEDAGFEIRDQLAWCYGSGFPKSHDVAKAIDKAAGASREIIGRAKGAASSRTNSLGKFCPEYDATLPRIDAARQWSGWGTALKPAWEPIVLARKPLDGTVAANVLAHGTGALNIDGCRVGASTVTHASNPRAERNGFVKGFVAGTETIEHQHGRWPANLITDGSEEVIAAFPASDGQQRGVTGAERAHRTVNAYGVFNGSQTGAEPRGDTGSAARFFFSAKAGEDDRCDSRHPTVKPVALMRWLARLITPPGGTVLDPFAGSGTTGVACLREGFKAILCEREDEYVADIRRRLARLGGGDTPLFALPARALRQGTLL